MLRCALAALILTACGASPPAVRGEGVLVDDRTGWPFELQAVEVWMGDGPHHVARHDPTPRGVVTRLPSGTHLVQIEVRVRRPCGPATFESYEWWRMWSARGVRVTGPAQLVVSVTGAAIDAEPTVRVALSDGARWVDSELPPNLRQVEPEVSVAECDAYEAPRNDPGDGPASTMILLPPLTD